MNCKSSPTCSSFPIFYNFTFLPYECGGIIYLIVFLGYLLDGEKEYSLASYVKETRALELGFDKKDVVGKEEHVGRSWTNAKFLCLLNFVKNKYWEYNRKPFKKSN
jgi:hypothetical protein